jgi:uncharacterized protein YeaC (DUF1315 family)
MDYQQLIDTMSPQIYQSLKRSVEVGKWPDGRALTQEQRETTMQAMIAWGEKHLPEQDRVGFIDKQHKAGDSCDDPLEMPLNWKDQES